MQREQNVLNIIWRSQLDKNLFWWDWSGDNGGTNCEEGGGE